MRLVPSPLHDQQTVYDDWADHMQIEDAKDPRRVTALLRTMGTGSDYTAFYHHLGIPSLDTAFEQGPVAGVYPYHSNYDSFYWMEHYGDPGFVKHLAVARLWGALAVRLAGVPLLQFRARDYAAVLGRHVQAFREKRIAGLELGPLEKAVDEFADATAALDELVRASGDGGVVSRSRVGVAEINRRFRAIEKSFLLKSGDGLPGRKWYKHIVSGPSTNSLCVRGRCRKQSGLRVYSRFSPRGSGSGTPVWPFRESSRASTRATWMEPTSGWCALLRASGRRLRLLWEMSLNKRRGNGHNRLKVRFLVGVQISKKTWCDWDLDHDCLQVTEVWSARQGV